MVDYHKDRRRIRKKHRVHDSLTDGYFSLIPKALIVVAAVGYGCKKAYDFYSNRKESKKQYKTPTGDLEKKL